MSRSACDLGTRRAIGRDGAAGLFAEDDEPDTAGEFVHSMYRIFEVACGDVRGVGELAARWGVSTRWGDTSRSARASRSPLRR